MKKIVKKFAVTGSHQPFISYGNRTKKQREKTWLYFVDTFVYVVFYGKLHKKNTTASLWENSKKLSFHETKVKLWFQVVLPIQNIVTNLIHF